MLRQLARLKWRTETVVMLGIARFLVSFVPLRRWRTIFGPIEQTSASAAEMTADPAARDRAVHVGRMVRTVATKLPFEAACLPQALAARWMLGMRGIPTRLFIGAKKDDQTNAMLLHAWLMYGEICLTGDRERHEFRPFGR